jgi:hypothetical protein
MRKLTDMTNEERLEFVLVFCTEGDRLVSIDKDEFKVKNVYDTSEESFLESFDLTCDHYEWLNNKGFEIGEQS